MKIRTTDTFRMLLLLLIIFSLLFGCYFGANSNRSCVRNESGALLKFKAGILDPSGRLSSWVGDDCCTWNGVVCDEKSGHVMELHLRNTDLEHSDWKRYIQSFLEGKVDPTIFSLTHLSYLDLSGNIFLGSTFPNILGSLQYLKYLNLSHSQFTGKVPHQLGNLSQLQYLDLSGNYFRLISEIHFASSLSSLKYMDLSGSDLSKCHDCLNSINMLPSLVKLHLSSCYISGNSEFVHANFTSLEVLDLSGNRFHKFYDLRWLFNISTLHHLDLGKNSLVGPIPIEMGAYDALAILDLSVNSFEGEIPITLRNLSSLYHLDLTDNNFDSSLPLWLSEISTIRHLYLSGNSFGGAVPIEIGNNSLLATLDLSNNYLEGEIPDSLSNFCNLQMLNLAENRFRGIIPGLLGNSTSCIGTSLNTLILKCNNFQGSLPEHFGQFHNLEQLDLSENYIEGSIPRSIGALSTLRDFFLSDNRFTGSIPEELGKLSRLEALDFSNNYLQGKFLELHLSNLKKLTILRMEGNFLVLDVGETWFPPFQIEEIGFSSCKVGPSFPQWLRTQTDISVLLLSNASISDRIPRWFENITYTISYLDLSHNQITGPLPTIGALRSNFWGTRIISLNTNNFEGPLTMFPSDITEFDICYNFIQGANILHTIVKMMPHLQILLVSNNLLAGTIPLSLRNLNLFILDLANNNLSGHIPKKLVLDNVLSLHLQNNSLKGRIPESWRMLTQLLFLDLSVNAFVGSIPPWIGGFSALVTLNVHSNMFDGEIPPQLCKLQYLRILDLANNQMIGKIPSCFYNFTAMTEKFSVSEYVEDFEENYRSSKHVEKILAYVKGKGLEYTSTLAYLCSIDLSRNNFFGAIPDGLMNLFGLTNLNLSGNNLNGHIPMEIGNLKALESLDLSRNELSGSVPPSISDLNFLSCLNLSFNNLSGRIPSGNQLQTLYEKSIYMGNNELCGPQLRSCSEDEAPRAHEHIDEKEKGDSEMIWFCSGSAAGFVAGFVGACSLLYWKHSWRYALFQMVDRIYDKIWIAVAVKANQLKRKFQRQT